MSGWSKKQERGKTNSTQWFSKNVLLIFILKKNGIIVLRRLIDVEYRKTRVKRETKSLVKTMAFSRRKKVKEENQKRNKKENQKKKTN